MDTSSDSPRPDSSAGLSPLQLLRRRDAILGGVARATELVSRASRWRDCADEMLRICGESTGVSRVYLFEFRNEAGQPMRAYQTHEWTAPGITPQIDNPDLQGIEFATSGFGRWVAAFERNEPIYGDIADFPAEEQPILEAQQILSLLVQPIHAGPLLWGMVGFDTCERIQRWEKVEVDALRIAAVVFGAAIQRESREATLQQMQRIESLGRMAGGVAHDFNNVLAVAAVATEVLLDDVRARGGPDDDNVPVVEALQQALAQGRGLTRRLLQFSRQQQGQPREVDVYETLRPCTPLLRQILTTGVVLELRGQPDLPPVHMDPVELEQVILNLVVNARDAMPASGTVTITVDAIETTAHDGGVDGLPAGRWVRLSVVDTGCGMSPEVRERIFEPFFTTKADDGGTGLGLPTVFGIVHGVGGRIAVTSSPGAGSTFRLSFPATKAGG